MNVADWDERYGAGQFPGAGPTPLVVETAQRLKAGRALDLACGAGRNAVWLAAQGWNVTAVDGSPTAIEILRENCSAIEARVADLERGEFEIEPNAWDLIVVCYYLQRDLFASVKDGLAPGGVAIAIVHLVEPGHEASRFSTQPGELASYFQDLEVLHSYEGKPKDPEHRRAVAEIVARMRP